MSRHDIPTSSAQSAPCRFAVRGYGEHAPAQVRFEDRAALDAAMAICDAEIALIDAAIKADRIPVPGVLDGDRPSFDATVERKVPEDDPGVFRYPPADLMETHGRAVRLLKRLGALVGVGGTQTTDVRPAPPSESEGPWPKISVVTVSFNQAQYLEASIRSVLDQNYPNLEYVVVDGGSTDGSVEIIERYRDSIDVVIVEPDRGQSDALNKGFGHATGETMNWLCSDDLLEPGSLFEIGRAFRDTRADIIAGGCMRIGETRDEEHHLHHTRLPMGETVRLAPLDMLHFMRSWQASNYFFQPETFFSRRIWEASGAYLKEHLFYAMDYDLWLRMALAGATARHIPATIGCSRIHAAQKTQADRKYLHQMRALMEEYKAMFAALKAA
jgi:GT2 family glycosyltransferase